ncbi:hypothetical protein [Sphingomonas endophytica]|uniref:NIPSNAP domain-containing protein n=1 Tax=Sphingomonas endophytica TaxID=869719 RepID=A0A147I6P6_9SPHN|nr:hypothetical protein [Sphingomonas endophytica]KTT74411.1 hypothetical protein NS334_05360 [Sphingomonas endophytica]
MQRRSLLRLIAATGAGWALPGAARAAAPKTTPKPKPIVLYCDLAVDPAREQEMLDAFHRHFLPAARSFRGRGFIDLKMLKLRTVIQGRPAPPAGVNYRFQLTYESEAQRQQWIRSDVHERNWPLIERTVLNRDYLVLLTDAV